ncbi:response regulator [Nonomuraea soli]|uniref:DNA-binding NarL/FixJ family response regulator n=1 Tax=Nonomuraea soli TaxID=1032476 RepID=A0A7W0CG07_9ACTN|nr:response regulator transcription factor [Nonomuraea soli]MBA2890324.1 DNA-binding NarL/FixJ family response regulator [Nonomuraea soli]
MTVRVLIADDHPVVRDGIRAMLETQDDLEVVGEAVDGAEAVRLAGTLRPDVTLMDLQLPELDGAGAIGRIRENDPGARVIVLTTYDTDSDISRAIDAGAIGYLLKDTRREQLFDAIRAAARGESALSPSIASRVLSWARSDPPGALSGREIEVLGAVARGLSNKAIAAHLCISEATVKTHLLHVFAKLGVDDRTAAVTVAASRGIIRLGP